MRNWIFGLALAFLANTALADGGTWGAFTDARRGNFECRGFLICDGKIAADSTCSEFNLATLAAGHPAFFIVSIITIDAECSGTPEFQVRGSHSAAGTKFDIGPQLTQAGTSSKSFDFADGMTLIDVNLTDDAVCDAPGNDVAIVVCYATD